MGPSLSIGSSPSFRLEIRVPFDWKIGSVHTRTAWARGTVQDDHVGYSSNGRKTNNQERGRKTNARAITCVHVRASRVQELCTMRNGDAHSARTGFERRGKRKRVVAMGRNTALADASAQSHAQCVARPRAIQDEMRFARSPLHMRFWESKDAHASLVTELSLQRAWMAKLAPFEHPTQNQEA